MNTRYTKHKLQALVYDILPLTTAITDYGIGLEKPVSNVSEYKVHKIQTPSSALRHPSSVNTRYAKHELHALLYDILLQ